MSDAMMTKLTVDSLRESLQQAGYRVETVTDPVANIPYLRSATAGLAFDIRPGNRFPGEEQHFADLAFVAVLQVQGELPLDLVNRWNATRRFARLQLSHPFLVFCLDVSVAGGVAPSHLRAQVEIWDRLVQELIAYLREELPKLAAANGATPPLPQQTMKADEPAREHAAEPVASAMIQ
jgi:putative sensory transduction regulator